MILPCHISISIYVYIYNYIYIYIYIYQYISIIYQFIYNFIWFETILLQHMVVQSISDTLLEDHENEKNVSGDPWPWLVQDGAPVHCCVQLTYKWMNSLVYGRYNMIELWITIVFMGLLNQLIAGGHHPVSILSGAVPLVSR